MKHPPWDLVIVGGGMAGLAAARRARAQSSQSLLLVLEGSETFGGAVRTIGPDREGLRWEAGAGRVEAKQRHVLELLREFEIETRPVQGSRQLVSKTYAHDGPTVDAYIRQVLEAARGQRAETLRNMSFADFARSVLGNHHARRFQTLFGYDAEFDWAQAAETLTSLRRSFAAGAYYFVVPSGLGSLVDALVKDLRRQSVQMFTRVHVRTVERDASGYVLHVNSPESQTRIHARRVLFAVPPASLRTLVPSLASLLETSLSAVPMMRVYARFSKPWTLPRVVTDGLLRQVIPVRPDQGLIMVAYVDTHRVAKLLDEVQKDAFPSRLLDELRSLYGRKAIETVGKLLALHIYPWEQGVHVWRVHASPARLRAALRALPPDMAVAGEAFSTEHGWMEGAIRTGYAAANRLLKS